MKTLGDLKGLLPTKLERGNGHETRCKCTVCFHSYGYAQAHDEISAIPLLDVVKKAVESGLIVVKPCEGCGSNGWYVGHRSECSLNREECCDCGGEQIQCEPCSGNGFTITEGEVGGG